jgi:hypothetical protein
MSGANLPDGRQPVKPQALRVPGPLR